MMQEIDKEQGNPHLEAITVEELENAEKEIVRIVQRHAFSKDYEALQSIIQAEHQRGKNALSKTSPLFRLDVFLDKDGILRIGGRIRRASIDDRLKHPMILPKRQHVSNLLIQHCHERVEHQGRGITLNEVRSCGYFVFGAKSIASKHIKGCSKCQRLRAVFQSQKMADLPKERVVPSTPFSYTAVDFFGPWYIKQGRSEVKRYGVLFTCLSSRAVHLEVSHTLGTDSFLNALRRFICRRGPVRQLQCDRGTNFVGASNELRKCLEEMDESKLKLEALKHNCDWFEFKFNVPKASHMGGVWERQIRTVRSVLNSLLLKNGNQLNEESLQTFMCEAECIVNCQPLTTDGLTSPDSEEPLTPNHLLTMKSKIVLPPPGVFQSDDIYLRKHWRRVKQLSNQFWTRWKKEFLCSLQERQKWISPKRNLKVGDIVEPLTVSSRGRV